ncbi:exopolysaccharide biosynthesis protein [Maricaulis sp. D1M11]|uniref:exopolysaccharide biosynthesis protein n=1 Tax=Maricaulis sp. D1M11 TaxID=3076117 RepID=UPI0039B47734
MSHDEMPQGGLISALESLAETAPEDGLSLGEFVDALGERAFGIILFAFALPVSIPFLYGVPQVVAFPMMFLALQMLAGRDEPWLPSRFRERNLSLESLQRMARGGRKWFGWLETLARPRLLVLSAAGAERVIGLVFTVFCASIMIPLPATNTTPGIAIAIASLGLVTRDGLLILLGLVLGTAWIALLIFVGDAALSMMKDVVTSWLSGSA